MSAQSDRERFFHLRVSDEERAAITALRAHFDRTSDSDLVRYIIRRSARELGFLPTEHAARFETDQGVARRGYEEVLK